MVAKPDQMPERHKVLITGAGGMLGEALTLELKKANEVSGIDIGECDITDRDKTVEVLSGAKPDIVIHAAAWTDVDGCELDSEKAYRVNSDGTENVALACKACGAVLIYISTDFVFDGKKKAPYKESDRPNPLSVYADSKLKGEDAVKRILERYFILRTSWLYGSHGKNFVDTILARAKPEGVLKVVDDQTGSPTYTKDLAGAIYMLLKKIFGGYGTYHITNSGHVSWYGYAREILRLAKSTAKVVPISSDELNRPARRPAMSILDNTKFIRFTGFKMRHWREALGDYLFQPG